MNPGTDIIFDRIWKLCVLALFSAILSVCWSASVRQRRSIADIDDHLSKIEQSLPDADRMETSLDSIDSSLDELAHAKR